MFVKVLINSLLCGLLLFAGGSGFAQTTTTGAPSAGDTGTMTSTDAHQDAGQTRERKKCDPVAESPEDNDDPRDGEEAPCEWISVPRTDVPNFTAVVDGHQAEAEAKATAAEATATAQDPCDQ